MESTESASEVHRKNANGRLGCLRPLTSNDPGVATCGCHITEPHAFVTGPRRMSTCFECGKGGSAKIHRV